MDLNVLGFHILDVIILLALIGIDVAINLAASTFQQFVGETTINNLRYPLKDDTVPFWAVPILSLGLPLLVFALELVISRKYTCKKFQELYNAVIGLLFTVALTSLLTDGLKYAVGQPRPDFFWRCFPNGTEVYNTTTGGVLCTGVASIIEEGHKSFPSGHSSWSFAGLGFLSIYLAHKLLHFRSRGFAASLLVVLAPLLMATTIAVTRLDDYMHRWQDVTIGGLLGLAIATMFYYQFLAESNGVVENGRTRCAHDATLTSPAAPPHASNDLTQPMLEECHQESATSSTISHEEIKIHVLKGDITDHEAESKY